MSDKVVLKVEEGMDRREILATTYQMRNPFHQFADAFASELDVMCYSIHQQAAKLCPSGGKVLDLCCGRGLLIPFLRYYTDCALYLGVDISRKNAKFMDGWDPRKRGGPHETSWPFLIDFIESNVGEMVDPIRKRKLGPFDLVVYTSSIEHMQPEAQRESLVQAARVAKIGASLYLTCPVTAPGDSGWETRYAAHVYEPSNDELVDWLSAAGWRIQEKFGLLTSSTVYRERLTGKDLGRAEEIYSAMARPFALCAIAAAYPQCATEVAYVCKRVMKKLGG